jgi:hypothetical protein
MLRPNSPGKTKRGYRKEERRSRAKKSGKIMGSCGRLQSRRRTIMTGTEEICTCVGSSVGEGENQPTLCPKCGKRIPAPKQFSDSMLEATYEVLAEEGGIWSGAR